MSFVPIIEDAQRVACKASIMLEGLTGTGKSGLALALGYILAGEDWSKVGCVDTENKSLKLFAQIPSILGGKIGKFKIGELTPDIGYDPKNYLIFRDALKKAGCTVCIEDSISHSWQYKGGVLDRVSELKQNNNRYAKDQYAAWGDAEVVTAKNALLDLIRDEDVHVITTVRVKEKMEYDKDENGKSKLTSLGEQQIQQAELKYEPDLVLHMLEAGAVKNNKIQYPKVRVIKSRYTILERDAEYEMTPALMLQIKQYLEDGVDPEELLEQQRQDYIKACKEYLDTHKNAIAVWKVLKADAGHENTKLEEMPLDIIKKIYITLTAD